MLGSSRPDVAGRVQRFTAVAEACRALLAGDEVTADGPYVYARAARLDSPRPVQSRVPFTFGGGGSALLRWAGRHAGVVALSGLGRTLPDGHSHETRRRGDGLDRQVELIEQGAVDREAAPPREALVQAVEITDDAQAAARRLPGDSAAPNVRCCPRRTSGSVPRARSWRRWRTTSDAGASPGTWCASPTWTPPRVWSLASTAEAGRFSSPRTDHPESGPPSARPDDPPAGRSPYRPLSAGARAETGGSAPGRAGGSTTDSAPWCERGRADPVAPVGRPGDRSRPSALPDADRRRAAELRHPGRWE